MQPVKIVQYLPYDEYWGEKMEIFSLEKTQEGYLFKTVEVILNEKDISLALHSKCPRVTVIRK